MLVGEFPSGSLCLWKTCNALHGTSVWIWKKAWNEFVLWIYPKYLLQLVVGSIFCGSGRVGSAICGLGLNLENFPQKRQIFQFLPFGSKKISSGRVRKYPSTRVGLLFTAG